MFNIADSGKKTSLKDYTKKKRLKLEVLIALQKSLY